MKNPKLTPQQVAVLRQLLDAEGKKPKKMAKKKAPREWTADETEMIWILVGAAVFFAVLYFS